MSDSGSRSPQVTFRKILSLEKKQQQAEVEIPNELLNLRDLSFDEVHSPRGMQYDPPNLREPHVRTLTDRGRAYQLEVRALRKQEVENKLRKHVGRIYSLLDSHPSTEELENEKQILDVIKEELNQAYRSYDELLDDESAKGAAYRYFDLCDREFIECRMRLTETFRQSNNESMKNSSLIGKKRSQQIQSVLEEQRLQVLQGPLGRRSCQREQRRRPEQRS